MGERFGSGVFGILYDFSNILLQVSPQNNYGYRLRRACTPRFIRHPESDYVLEQEWLYEAITETYIPLLKVFEGLKRDGIDFKITMSMTPPLVSMLRDPLLQERYEADLAQLEELIQLEAEHNTNNGHLHYLAEHYATEFKKARQLCDRQEHQHPKSK